MNEGKARDVVLAQWLLTIAIALVGTLLFTLIVFAAFDSQGVRECLGFALTW